MFGRVASYVLIAALALGLGGTSVAVGGDDRGIPALWAALFRDRPVYLESGDQPQMAFALGSDPFGPVKCETAPYVAPRPQRALVTTWLTLKGDAALTYTTTTVTQVDGGGWVTDGFGWQRASVTTAGEWSPTSYVALVDLNAGSMYRFGVQVGRSYGDGGAGNALAYRCHLVVQITNRTTEADGN